MSNGKKWLKYSLHIAVLLGVVWAGFKYIDGEQFRNALEQFSWIYAPFVGLLGLASLVTKSWRFASILKKANDIERPVAMKAYISGQSATLLPGGIAARAALLDQVGIRVGESSPAIALSSITDQLGFLVLGVFSAFFFEPARKPVLILVVILAIVSILLGVEATRMWIGKVFHAILGRFNKEKEWDLFVQSMRETLTVRLVVVGVLNALLAFTFLSIALYLCIRGSGISISPMLVLFVFAVPTMLGRISALPGGFGVTEVGMVGILDSVPDVTLDQAAAAVFVFRIGTVVFTALAGGLVYLFSWRSTVKEVTA